MNTSSLTDRPDWRAFARAAANDLSLLDRDPDGVLADVVGERSFREARYERITDELVDRFGPLTGMTILEIGGGYGGQALSILRRFPTVRYAIRDLPEPRRLQKTFLQHNGGYPCFNYVVNPALAISNYAVSELRRQEQTSAMVWMRGAARGYIRWNGWVTQEIGIRQFVAMCPPGAKAERVDDDRNRLVTWGRRG